MQKNTEGGLGLTWQSKQEAGQLMRREKDLTILPNRPWSRRLLIEARLSVQSSGVAVVQNLRVRDDVGK